MRHRALPPELKGRRLLIHKETKSMVEVLTHLTSRLPAKMFELRKLFPLTDEHDISIGTMHIRRAAKIWAGRLSRKADNADL